MCRIALRLVDMLGFLGVQPRQTEVLVSYRLLLAPDFPSGAYLLPGMGQAVSWSLRQSRSGLPPFLERFSIVCAGKTA